MLRCGSFIGLSSATALRGRRGRFGGPVALPQAKVTRSNRVGCARKAWAARAGTVAGSIYPGLAINRQGFTRRMRTAMTSSSSPRRKSTLTSRGLRSRTIAPRFGMRSQFLSFLVRTARATDVPRWVSKFAHRSCSTRRSRGAP
jgi:hypothetical protein